MTMIFPAAFGLAALLVLVDGRPPKKGSPSGAQAFPAVDPEDYIKTCVDENARRCTQVYLHENGVACKYALSGRKIYESGTRPRTLSSEEIKALRKYAADVKVYNAKIKQWKNSSWPSKFNPFEMVKRTKPTDMPVMPTMPCFCRTCPNRPGGTKTDDSQTTVTELPGSTSPVLDVSTTGSPLAGASGIPASTEGPANTTTDLLVRHDTGAPVSASTDTPVSDTTTDEPQTDAIDEPQTGSTVEPSSGEPGNGATDEPLPGSTDDEPSSGSTDEHAPFSTDGFPFNDDPLNETTAQPASSTDVPLVEGTDGSSNGTSDEPLPGSTDGEQSTDEPVSASTDDFPFNDDPSNETTPAPSDPTGQPPLSTDGPLVEGTDEPLNGTSDEPHVSTYEPITNWTEDPLNGTTGGPSHNSTDAPLNETSSSAPNATDDVPTQAWSTHAPSTVAWTDVPSTAQPRPNGTYPVASSNGTNSSDAGPIKVNINVGINISGGQELLTKLGSKVAQVIELLKGVH